MKANILIRSTPRGTSDNKRIFGIPQATAPDLQYYLAVSCNNDSFYYLPVHIFRVSLQKHCKLDPIVPELTVQSYEETLQ